MDRQLTRLIYQEGTYNLTGSILRRFGLEGPLSLNALDRFLEKGYRNVLVLILDGLGVELAQKSSFLSEHIVRQIYSVYPPTTTASLTTLYSGLSPIEHGWLGWNVYFPQLPHDAVTLFLNEVMDQKVKAADYVVTDRYLPYESIVSRLVKAGVSAESMNPFEEPRISSLDQLFIRSLRLFSEPGEHFVMGYWTEPDYTQHEHGKNSRQARDKLAEIERSIKTFVDSFSDTLIVILSDHGMIDATPLYLEDYPEMQSLLTRRISLEARNPCFFLKPGTHEKFSQLFHEAFDDFELYTHDEYLQSGLLGQGTPHPSVATSVGDFVGVARGTRYLLNDRLHDKGFIGVHAGLTEEEMMIPLIIIERP